jgi:hypothetical protein
LRAGDTVMAFGKLRSERAMAALESRVEKPYTSSS